MRIGFGLLLVMATSMAFPLLGEAAAEKEGTVPPLFNPKGEEMNKTAPDQFQARFETSKGEFVIDVHRDWAPNGADRFFNLVRNGFFDDARFFRVIAGFMVQFGINGDPKITGAWSSATIPDDPVKQGNGRGQVTFAKTGQPNSRSTQLFINFQDNSRLDSQGFASFGQVIQGMDIVDKLYSGYGEGAPSGRGPDQNLLKAQGNEYLKAKFPELDYIKKAAILEEPISAEAAKN
ncbi:MAG: peptidylprolyl isomerase [Acidobacteria bacterium]|nr:peptidylprolyl isomerase [Acidobacteriota bacterium]